MIFPVVGYAMGIRIKRIKTDEQLDLFYKKIFAGGVMAFTVMASCLKAYGLDPLLIAASPANDYITDFFNVVLDIGIACIWFGLIHFAYKKIHSIKVKRAADYMSRAILIFFCLQWVIIEWVVVIIALAGYENIVVFNSVSFGIASTLVFAFSLGMAILVILYKDKKSGYVFQE